jgi:hypothetical protein
LGRLVKFFITKTEEHSNRSTLGLTGGIPTIGEKSEDIEDKGVDTNSNELSIVVDPKF